MDNRLIEKNRIQVG